MPGQVKRPRLCQTSVAYAKCKMKQPGSCRLHGICMLAVLADRVRLARRADIPIRSNVFRGNG